MTSKDFYSLKKGSLFLVNSKIYGHHNGEWSDNDQNILMLLSTEETLNDTKNYERANTPTVDFSLNPCLCLFEGRIIRLAFHPIYLEVIK